MTIKITEKCGCTNCDFKGEINSTNEVLVENNDFNPDFLYCPSCQSPLVYYGLDLVGPDTTTEQAWRNLAKKLSSPGWDRFDMIMNSMGAVE